MNIEKAVEAIAAKEVETPVFKHIMCPCESGRKFEACHGAVKEPKIAAVSGPFPEFVPFRKIPRWKRTIVVSEKIDGTNAQIFFDADGIMWTGSRNRWITPEKDNAGFARWAKENEEALRGLGQGHHYGEWYGAGIQRRYGLAEKRFALFNSSRWTKENPPPACCQVVPVLYDGIISEARIEECLEYLRDRGSVLVPLFMRPEGVVIYHVASGTMHKRTLENDESPKGQKEEC